MPRESTVPAHDGGTVAPALARNAVAAASRVILSRDQLNDISYLGIEEALKEHNTEVLLFGKPNARVNRRMGVALAIDETIEKARKKADNAAKCISIVEKIH